MISLQKKVNTETKAPSPRTDSSSQEVMCRGCSICSICIEQS